MLAERPKSFNQGVNEMPKMQAHAKYPTERVLNLWGRYKGANTGAGEG